MLVYCPGKFACYTAKSRNKATNIYHVTLDDIVASKLTPAHPSLLFFENWWLEGFYKGR